MFVSSDEERELVDALKLAAITYIQKPASFEQLAKAALRLGLRWLVVERPEKAE